MCNFGGNRAEGISEPDQLREDSASGSDRRPAFLHRRASSSLPVALWALTGGHGKIPAGTVAARRVYGMLVICRKSSKTALQVGSERRSIPRPGRAVLVVRLVVRCRGKSPQVRRFHPLAIVFALASAPAASGVRRLAPRGWSSAARAGRRSLASWKSITFFERSERQWAP